MPDLQGDPSAFGMNGVGDFFPAGHLSGGMNAWLAATEGRITFHRHCSFSNKKAGAGTLSVILSHDSGRDMFGIGPAACKRCHEDPIGKLEQT